MKYSKNTLQNKFKSVRGFTLLELVIVIAIIGILAVIVLPNFINALGKARDAKKMSELRGMQTFLTTEGINTGLRYPQNEADFKFWASSTKSRLPQGFTSSSSQAYFYTGIACDANQPTYVGGFLYSNTCAAYQLWTELEQDNAALRLDSDLQLATACTVSSGPCVPINATFGTSTTTFVAGDFDVALKLKTGSSEACLSSAAVTSAANGDCVFDLVP